MSSPDSIEKNGAIGALVLEVRKLKFAIDAVRVLHHPSSSGQNACAHDGMRWPCPTARALDKEIL